MAQAVRTRDAVVQCVDQASWAINAQATKSKYQRPNSFPHVMPEAGTNQGYGPAGSPPPSAGASFGTGTATPPPGQDSGPSFGAQRFAQASGNPLGALQIFSHLCCSSCGEERFLLGTVDNVQLVWAALNIAVRHSGLGRCADAMASQK